MYKILVLDCSNLRLKRELGTMHYIKAISTICIVLVQSGDIALGLSKT